MEDYTIKDSQILVQTVYDEDYENYGPQNARLHNSLGYRADPSLDASSNFLGINLGEETVITAIATQGYSESSAAEWLKSFSVNYEDSTGNRVTVRNSDGILKVGLVTAVRQSWREKETDKTNRLRNEITQI